MVPQYIGITAKTKTYVIVGHKKVTLSYNFFVHFPTKTWYTFPIPGIRENMGGGDVGESVRCTRRGSLFTGGRTPTSRSWTCRACCDGSSRISLEVEGGSHRRNTKL